MAKYSSREKLYADYLKMDDELWCDWISTLLVDSSTITTPLYHISFKKSLPSTITPLEPHTHDSDSHPVYHEPLPPRISTSTSLIGCWRGIYANYSSLLESEEAEEQIVFHLYQIIPHPDSKLLLPKTATDEWLLYDAHETHEHCIFGQATAKYLGHVTIENTSQAPLVEHRHLYPFELKRYPKLYANPPFRIVSTNIPNTVTIESATLIKPHLEKPMFQYVDTPIYDMLTRREETITLEYANLSPYALAKNAMQSIDSIFSGMRSLGQNLANVSKHGVEPNLYAQQLKDFNINIISDGKLNYRTVRGVSVGVPIGFTGTLSDYQECLHDITKSLANILDDVIKPTTLLTNRLIADPSLLQSMSNSSFSGVHLHLDEIDLFKTRMNKLFNSNKLYKERTIGELTSSLNEYAKTRSQATSLAANTASNYRELGRVHQGYRDMQTTVQSLLLKVNQDPTTYAISKLNTEKLANLLKSVAHEIEVYAGLYHYTEQFLKTLRYIDEAMITAYVKEKEANKK